ncbi:MAG TPA: hypothetical protein DCM05_10980 [Elusimicrobia bacterium]|nr:hypothetical protein [Elusimicrobiota bacterium]
MKALLLLFTLPLAALESPLSLSDFQGNFLSVTNRFNGSVDFIHLKKLDRGGGLVWENSRNPLGVDLRASAVSVDPAGNLVIAALRGSGPKALLSVLRYRMDGQLDWERDYDDGQRNVPTAAAIDREGNIYLGGNVLRGGRSIAKLWKLDPFGTVRWSREYGDVGNNYASQLQLDIRGSILLGVEVYYSQTAVSGQYTLVSVEYDPEGHQVSVR